MFDDRKISRRAFVAAAGAAGTAGCLGGARSAGGEDGQAESAGTTTDTATRETTPTPTPSPERETVELLLNWKPSGLHVPYYTARARGYYEAAGFSDVTITAGQGSDFSAKQVGLGNVAFAVTSSDQLLNINSRDLAPRSVGVVMQRSPVVVFSTREAFGGALESVDQLAGRTVGTGPGMVRILTELLLERRGILDEVELVDTGYDTVQQVLAGEVDAAGGVFGDAVSTRARGRTVDSIPVAETIPSYGHVVATDGSFADANPATVRAFLRATARGAAWARANPGSATDLLVEANGGLAESRAQQREKWTTMAEGFVVSPAVREHGWGWSRPEPWRVTADALAEADLLGGPVDPDAVWTNDYLDTGYEYIGSYADSG